MTNDCPCRGCELRCQDCHSSCEPYKAWAAAKAEVNAAASKIRKAEGVANSFKLSAIRRAEKQKRRKT